MTEEQKAQLAAMLEKLAAKAAAQEIALKNVSKRAEDAEALAKAQAEKIAKLAENPLPEKASGEASAILKATIHNPLFMAKGTALNQKSAEIDGEILPIGPAWCKSWPAGIGIDSSNVGGKHRAGLVERGNHVGVRLRDILTVKPVKEKAIEYTRAKYSELAALVATSAALNATALVLDNVNGFYAGQKITITASNTSHTATVSAVTRATNTLTLAAPGLTIAAPAGAVVTSETFVFTPETQIKPRAKAEFKQETASVLTLATWIPVTRQALEDETLLRGYIEGELLEALVMSEERQILKGAGGNDQLLGFFNDPEIKTYKWEDGEATDTKVDAIRRAMMLVLAAGRAPADALILSEWDSVDIDTHKNAIGNYTFGGPSAAATGVTRIWGVPVVRTQFLDKGEALIGAFKTGATLWDRTQGMIRTSEQHEDFFVRNCVALLAEERVALTISRPESFVKIDLSTPPEPPAPPVDPEQQG